MTATIPFWAIYLATILFICVHSFFILENTPSTGLKSLISCLVGTFYGYLVINIAASLFLEATLVGGIWAFITTAILAYFVYFMFPRRSRETRPELNF